MCSRYSGRVTQNPDDAASTTPAEPMTRAEARAQRRQREGATRASDTAARSEHRDSASAGAAGEHASDSGSDHESSHPMVPHWLQRIVTVVAVWAVWALISTFLVQPFKIPSASMENTLPIGDRIIVNKLSDGTDVKRGDVVVFSDERGWEAGAQQGVSISSAIRKFAEVTKLSASGTHLVKRVVGLPGDKISCSGGGKLTVNGTAVSEPYVKSGVGPCASPVGDSDWSVTVPADHLWVMGDNRANSADSRYFDANSGGKMGSIPVSSVTGEVIAVAWPLTHLGGSPSDESAFSKVSSSAKK